jgi:hypothetical protein
MIISGKYYIIILANHRLINDQKQTDPFPLKKTARQACCPALALFGQPASRGREPRVRHILGKNLGKMMEKFGRLPNAKQRILITHI